MKCFLRNCLSLLLQFCIVVLTASNESQADDWPQWGGPKRDIVWREKGIVKSLPEGELLPRVWSTKIGEGYSGPAVAKGKVYVTDFVDRKGNTGNERVLCLDAENGKILWKHATKVTYKISYPFGPRCTPVVNQGRVYTVGAMGHLFCLDANTGKELWQKNFREDFGTQLPIWGVASTPLIEGNQLITLVGGKKNSLVVSFDKKTGKEIWRSLEDDDAGYAPMVIFEFAGKRQLIVWHPDALSSLNPSSGKVIWQVPFKVGQGATIVTPRKFRNRIFVSSFYDGPRMIEVSKDGLSAKTLWKGKHGQEKDAQGIFALSPSPWMTENYIYGVSSFGELRCLDANTGKRIWETFEATGDDLWWCAFVIPHEDRFFIHNEQGDLIIANLSPKGYHELSRAKLIEPTRDTKGRRKTRKVVWSHPAFAMKSVFARNDKEIVRVSLAAKPGK